MGCYEALRSAICRWQYQGKECSSVEDWLPGMTFDYTKSAETAERLLQKFGQAVTLSRPSTSAPTYDPATGVSSPVAPATYSGRGAVFDYKQTDVNATLVQAGDQRLYLSPFQADGTAMPEPTTSDDVALADATVYSVQRAGKVAPAGTVVLYDLQLRGV